MGHLFVLDILPAGADLETQVDGWPPGVVRFRARKDGEASLWSGWFTWTGMPIQLNWVAFDWDDDR